MGIEEEYPSIAARKDPRYPQLRELRVGYEGFSEEIELRPPDISPHGMFLNTAREFPEGAILKVTFRLARSGTLVQTRSEVRYCLKGVGVGVEFIDISADAVRAIEEEMGLQSPVK
ncbi:MAG: PilZ domain-containing protein [Acidobacteriia bacterium]|nr:PilZ domain-containing protein [Terriglobia bacterium]